MTPDDKPKLAVWTFASCGGCQLALLNLEDELLAITQAVEIARFEEASSAVVEGPYDISLVEGSISTPHNIEQIKEIRDSSKILISIGACATSGGIQSLRNFKDIDEFISLVYATPEFIETLATSDPVEKHVPVDFQLQGCPINNRQLAEVVSALLNGRKPNLPPHSLCAECKTNQTICVMVARGTPCMGPVTQAGCGAICPSFNRGCYSCFGPMETPNTKSLGEMWGELGASEDEIMRAFRGYYADIEPFRGESEAHDK
jgi:coenzyme F420-reducing hydrogenase gamma subunit